MYQPCTHLRPDCTCFGKEVRSDSKQVGTLLTMFRRLGTLTKARNESIPTKVGKIQVGTHKNPTTTNKQTKISYL
jgi:hypothetical protein